jgi:hypothetical protein
MRRILVVLLLSLLSSPALAVESLAVIAVGEPPSGPGPELAEMTHQLREACRERGSNVQEMAQMRSRLIGQESSSTLAELERAYDGGYAAYSVMDFKTAIQTFQTVVEELERSPESQAAYDLWLKAILHLAYARESSGDGDSSELLGRVFATDLTYRLDPSEYPPSLVRKANKLRAALKGATMRKLTISSSAGLVGAAFVNGRPVGSTPVSVMLPSGKYRVGGIAGSTRVPSVQVELRAEDATVALDFGLAGAVRVDAGPGVAIQKSERAAGIVRTGAWLGVDRVLAASVSKEGSAQFLVGSLYDVRRGALLREGTIRLAGGSTPAAVIGALAGFILNGQRSPDVVPTPVEPPKKSLAAVPPVVSGGNPIPTPAPSPSEPRIHSSAPWYLVAAGAAVVAIGTGFALAASSAASSRDKAGTGTKYVDADVNWRKYRTMSGVTLGLGGAAVAGGLAWRFAF